jgi:hypothetical protein
MRRPDTSGLVLEWTAAEMTLKKITLPICAANLPVFYVIASLAAGLPGGAFAADLTFPQPEPAVAPDDPVAEYFAAWYDRVDAAMASEPDWMNPITTVTPRLVNQIRYDQFQQFLGNGAEVNNYFGGKALELIPTTTNEILINIPAFEQRTNVKPATVKDRIASVLWKPPGADRFCSRQTWGRQVAYGSQFESPHDRALNAAQDIRYRLGWKDYASIDDCMPPKPKWMRWRTYERIIQRCEANEAICNQYLWGILARLKHQR